MGFRSNGGAELVFGLVLAACMFAECIPLSALLTLAAGVVLWRAGGWV